MIARLLAYAAPVLAAVLLAGVVFAAPGDHVSAQDFDLTGNNSLPNGITWDGTSIVVVDFTDEKVYTYSTSGSYTSSSDFNLNQLNGSPQGIAWTGTQYALTDSTANPKRLILYTSEGNYSSHFNLAIGNGNPVGTSWDGANLRVADSGTNKVFTYTTGGTHSSASDFNLTSENNHASGITWDGAYYRVVDSSDDKVYTYNSSGNYISDEDFDLADSITLSEDNGNATGITWDGTYFRVTDEIDDKVYTYEGPTDTSMPMSMTGLSDSTEYAALVSAEVTAYGAWKCIRSTGGIPVKINNAEVRIHGFCAQPHETAGMEVEIHLPSTASYADLARLANVSGQWWFLESGAPATADQRIYNDRPTTEASEVDEIEEHALAFTEELGGLEPSTRLGFATMAKSVSDDDCMEEEDDGGTANDGSDDNMDDTVTSGRGFVCNRSYLTNLSATDTGLLLFGLRDENDIEFADTPTTPESVKVQRSLDHTSAEVSWVLYDAVTEYEVERLTAVQVDVADASRIEYGDPVTYMVGSTQAGVSAYTDTTLQAHRTYQFRVRARGADAASWSAWTEYVFSGAEPEVDIRAPGNLELERNSTSITASWTAPTGDFSNYTLQRQELILAEGSTFFGNITTLGGNSWLPGDTTTYTDTTITPDQTYEYRIAAVDNDQVGTYSDWFRIGPVDVSLGDAPANLHIQESGRRVFDERYEYWVAWDEVGRADDYQVQVAEFDLNSADITTSDYYVSDPTYFQTAFSRSAIRVRARKVDATLCAGAPANTCHSEWTSWADVRFTPAVEIAAVEFTDDTADTQVMDLREDLEDVVEAVFTPIGTDVDSGQVLEFAVLVFGAVFAVICVAVSWRRGMAPLGVGMGAAILILILFAGYRLLGINVAWVIALQSLLALAGFAALVRQFGPFR